MLEIDKVIDRSLRDDLLSRVSSYISEKRIAHTLAVAETAVFLASKLDKSLIRDAYISAMLHDVAKEMDSKTQIELISESDFLLTEEDLATIPALHSFAGAVIVDREFSDYSNNRILSAVFNHTLGSSDMTLLDKIIFIADYIEPTRKAEPCIKVREYLLRCLNSADSGAHIKALDSAIIMAIDFTEGYLIQTGKSMNSRSKIARDSLKALI